MFTFTQGTILLLKEEHMCIALEINYIRRDIHVSDL